MNSGSEGGPANHGDPREQARRFQDGIRIDIQTHGERIAELAQLADDHPDRATAPLLIAQHRAAIARLRVHLPAIPVGASSFSGESGNREEGTSLA